MGFKNYSAYKSGRYRLNVFKQNYEYSQPKQVAILTLSEAKTVINFTLDHIAYKDNYIIYDKNVAILKLLLNNLIKGNFTHILWLFYNIREVPPVSESFIYAFVHNRNAKNIIDRDKWLHDDKMLLYDIKHNFDASLNTDYYELLDFILSCYHILDDSEAFNIKISNYGKELYEKMQLFTIHPSLLTYDGKLKMELRSTLFGTGKKIGRQSKKDI